MKTNNSENFFTALAADRVNAMTHKSISSGTRKQYAEICAALISSTILPF